MSESFFTNVTAAIPTWTFKQSIVLVNPSNPDDKMEFDSIEAMNAEMFRLKAEVERLKNNCDYLDRELDREIEKTAMLCGQVERLRKHGDAMAEALEAAGFNNARDFWNAAKEGKPTE